jgi:outer membrane receptor protein involved in Fe transport
MRAHSPHAGPLSLALAGALYFGATIASAQDNSQPSASQTEPRLEEIVVTATRRTEDLTKVPMSITALSQKDMDRLHIHDMSDVARYTPGVTFDSTGASNAISIRGISSSVGFATTGVYIDDTMVPMRSNNLYSTGTAFPDIFDLDRVEVLRGPQGTLFGAGSEGGAIRFITPQPSLTTDSIYSRAEASFTEYGGPSYDAGIAAGGPLEQGEIGGRVSLYYQHDGGYIDQQSILPGGLNIANSNWADTLVGRAALTIAPTATLKITTSVFLQDYYINDADTFNQPFSNTSAGDFRNQNVLRTPRTDRWMLPSVRVELTLPEATFISLSSYFNRSNPNTLDYTEIIPALLGLSPYPTGPGQDALTQVNTKQDVFTQEFRLQSLNSNAPLRWTVGAYFSRSRLDTYESAYQPYLSTLIQNLTGLSLQQVFGIGLLDGGYEFEGQVVSNDTQTAGFGQLDYRIFDKLTLTAGVRVSRTEFDFNEFQQGVFAGGYEVQSGSESETPVTPKFVASYQLNPNNLLYASAAKGFRMGGVNAPIATTPGCSSDLAGLGLGSAPPLFKSDTTWSYEIGSKNTLFDNKLRIASSLYHIDWLGIQQSVYLPNCGQGFVGNLGSATSQGGDLSLTGLVGQHLVLSFALGYDDARYNQTISSGAFILVKQGESLTDYAPWTGTIAADYTFAVWGDKQAYLHGDFEHIDHYPNLLPGTYSYDPALVLANQPRNQQLNLRTGLQWAGWDVSVYANNILNDFPILNYEHTTPASPLFDETTLRPRTIGLTAYYRY